MEPLHVAIKPTNFTTIAVITKTRINDFQASSPGGIDKSSSSSVIKLTLFNDYLVSFKYNFCFQHD